MWGLVGMLASSAIKYGYDQYSKNQDRSEKREFHDYVNASNYGYQLRSLKEFPSAQREGLERAGYNPMLALGNIGSSSYGGSSVSSGDMNIGSDLISSAKEGAHLADDIFRALDDKHQESDAQTDLLVSEAESKKIQAENDTLRTLSQLENDAVERDLKESQNTKTKVDTISQPLSDAAKIGTGAATAWALNKLRKNAVEKFAPRVIPLLKHVPKGVGLFNPLTVLPTLFGGVATAIGYEGFKRTNHQQNEKLKRSGGTYQHGNWSR